jgi:hypothetical protein
MSVNEAKNLGDAAVDRETAWRELRDARKVANGVGALLLRGNA